MSRASQPSLYGVVGKHDDDDDVIIFAICLSDRCLFV